MLTPNEPLSSGVTTPEEPSGPFHWVPSTDPFQECHAMYRSALQRAIIVNRFDRNKLNDFARLTQLLAAQRIERGQLQRASAGKRGGGAREAVRRN